MDEIFREHFWAFWWLILFIAFILADAIKASKGNDDE